MKKSSAVFFQAITVLIGIGALAFMLLEPHLEGRNAHATLYQIYFNDLFLACAYTASIPFFVALYQTFRLFGYLGHKIFLPQCLKALRTIRYCMITLLCFLVVAEAYLFIVRPGDDIAGGVFIGLLMIFAFSISATAAIMFERTLRR